MTGFCASIVLAFISRVELFDYVVDGGNLREPGWGGGGGEKPNGLKIRGIKPTRRHGSVTREATRI